MDNAAIIYFKQRTAELEVEAGRLKAVLIIIRKSFENYVSGEFYEHKTAIDKVLDKKEKRDVNNSTQNWMYGICRS